MPNQPITPRERVKTALGHQEPDRVPVDFLATPEVWRKLVAYFGLPAGSPNERQFFDPVWEAILQQLQVDCRVVSYDQFCRPPASALHAGAVVEWWDVLTRSTPSRMWRQQLPNGMLYDIWGRPMRIVEHATGAYEEAAGWALQQATSVAELKNHPWPEPDWWDFSPLPRLLDQLDRDEQYHIRFRIGSVFESSWQLRGMEEFLIDLAVDPDIPAYIMERITDIHLENTRRVLELAGERLDMLYFYDDVATQNSLMISPEMWRKYVKPHHARLVDLAKSYNKPVMYHCDGAIYPLIPELLALGIDLLNPIQTDAKDMAAQRLKDEFGHQLSFHGGIDIIKTLPQGTPQDVSAEVRERVRVLGRDGGYILASSHHIQPDTPLENVLAMYDVSDRIYSP